MHGLYVGRDFMAVTRFGVLRVIVAYASRSHDARKQDFHLKRAVLMKDPVESVFVIAHVGKPRKHKLARAARFIMQERKRRVINMLPQNSAVTFIKRDGSL